MCGDHACASVAFNIHLFFKLWWFETPALLHVWGSCLRKCGLEGALWHNWLTTLHSSQRRCSFVSVASGTSRARFCLQNAQAQAGVLAYTLRTKTLSYSECAGHASLKAHAHTRTQLLNWKHTNTHTQALISLSYTAQAGQFDHTHTHAHTYIHTCTQHFAFDAEITHRWLFLTFK